MIILSKESRCQHNEKHVGLFVGKWNRNEFIRINSNGAWPSTSDQQREPVATIDTIDLQALRGRDVTSILEWY